MAQLSGDPLQMRQGEDCEMSNVLQFKKETLEMMLDLFFSVYALLVLSLYEGTLRNSEGSFNVD